MARSADPMSYATVAAWVYNPGIPLGVLRPDDPAMGEIADRDPNNFGPADERCSLSELTIRQDSTSKWPELSGELFTVRPIESTERK